MEKRATHYRYKAHMKCKKKRSQNDHIYYIQYCTFCRIYCYVFDVDDEAKCDDDTEISVHDNIKKAKKLDKNHEAKKKI